PRTDTPPQGTAVGQAKVWVDRSRKHLPLLRLPWLAPSPPVIHLHRATVPLKLRKRRLNLRLSGAHRMRQFFHCERHGVETGGQVCVNAVGEGHASNDFCWGLLASNSGWRFSSASIRCTAMSKYFGSISIPTNRRPVRT